MCVVSRTDLDGVDAEASGNVDGVPEEVKSQSDAGVRRRGPVEQVSTDGRLVQGFVRHLVTAEMKHAQRLDVLRADNTHAEKS